MDGTVKDSELGIVAAATPATPPKIYYLVEIRSENLDAHAL
jgi:hypothetical protein